MIKSLFSKIEFFFGIVVLLALVLFIKTITILQNISYKTGDTSSAISMIIDEVHASGNSNDKESIESKTSLKISDNKDTTKDIESDNSIVITERSDNVAIGEFNSDQVKLLKQLSERRKNIDKREEGLKNQENILKTLKSNITHKIQELKAVQKNIDDSRKRHDNEEKERMQKLVKIYEKMNPKKAAAVFNELDTAFSSEVVINMNHSKVGAILSYMHPVKARELSMALARR